MKFVDVKIDIAFKKVFGNESKKGILISFLNAVLDLKDERKIQDIELANPYQLPKIKELKETILDIKATDTLKNTFIVEMQVESQPFFDKRVLYYTSKAYVSQIDKGHKYPQLKPVVFIGIMDFDYFEDDHYISRHLIYNAKTLKQELSDFEFNFIDLTKFNKTEDELETIVDKWIFFIKNVGNLKMIPKNAADTPELQDAYELAAEYMWTKEELEVYEYWQIKEQDRIGSIEYAENKGREVGREEGIDETYDKIVLFAHENGKRPQEIHENTGIPFDKILQILKRNNKTPHK